MEKRVIYTRRTATPSHSDLLVRVRDGRAGAGHDSCVHWIKYFTENFPVDRFSLAAPTQLVGRDGSARSKLACQMSSPWVMQQRESGSGQGFGPVDQRRSPQANQRGPGGASSDIQITHIFLTPQNIQSLYLKQITQSDDRTIRWAHDPAYRVKILRWRMLCGHRALTRTVGKSRVEDLTEKRRVDDSRLRPRRPSTTLEETENEDSTGFADTNGLGCHAIGRHRLRMLLRRCQFPPIRSMPTRNLQLWAAMLYRNAVAAFGGIRAAAANVLPHGLPHCTGATHD